MAYGTPPDYQPNMGAAIGALSTTRRVNPVSATAYTVLASDAGQVLTCTNSSLQTLTFPSGLGTGFYVDIVTLGAANVLIANGTGTTIHPATLNVAQYSTARVTESNATNFIVSGGNV